MFQYYPTNGEHGEILVARADGFIGFIRNLGGADRWAAYDRSMNLLGENFGSQGQAATACWHSCSGKPKILIHDLLLPTAAR
jgi:hypothetical protein